ncbi:hypothetical protein GCM10009765_06220 [Fodinicola feengrottensis]|uniref:PPOX class F420-dependent oxidoreductase n=1 Tax=Fodinicola feengrottensis TaxID=435914 RepID=A0ABN2FU13_9ACTN
MAVRAGSGYRYERVGKALVGMLQRLGHPAAGTVTTAEVRPWDVRTLRRHRYCLLVTYRADGTAVPTPVWFGAAGDRVYVETGIDAYKTRRIRREPAVLVAPCTSRGRPTGPPMAGVARVLDLAEGAAVERIIQANNGLVRRLYTSLLDGPDTIAYLEIGPR